MKILLGDLKAKVDREDFFKLAIGNKRLNKISNDNGVREVLFATYKNITVIIMISPHCSIHRYTWMSPHENT
jgi:hypothetical protein